jgi:hypothetical protein
MKLFKRKLLSEKEIISGLRALKGIPARDPEIINSSKNTYLAEITKSRLSVSASEEARHTGWIANLFLRKEPLRMSTLGTIILIISMIVGGSGITAVSAQSSLPDSSLYPVKLLTEDIQFSFTRDPYAKWQLSLQLTESRMEEIRAMLSNGSIPSEAVLQRLNTQLEQTLQLASNLGGVRATQALTQTQTRLETQAQMMLLVQTSTPKGAAVLARVQQMIQERIRQTQNGLENPLQLQQQLQQQTQQQLQQQGQTQSQTGTQSGNGGQPGTPTQQGQGQVQTPNPPACSGKGNCGNGN